MAQEVKQWITVNGNHIPIFDGQSKEQAINAFLSNQKRANDDEDNDEENDPPSVTIAKAEATISASVHGSHGHDHVVFV